MDSAPKVAILVETSTGWGRRLIQGITQYVQKHQAWRFQIDAHDAFSKPRVPTGGDVSGVIARIRSRPMARALARLRVPVVNVSGIELPGEVFPRVTTHYAATANLAAQHFIERGYRQFGYVGPLELAHVKRHAAAFRSEVSKLPETCSLFDSTPSLSGRNVSRYRSSLDRWLMSMPRSSGVFSWSIDDAMLVLERCAELQIAIPDDIAVLAGDDDPLLCNMTCPTLSGLVVASEQIGYQAAQRLHRLMRGLRDARRPQLIDPVQITTRGSTDALAIADPELSRAVIAMRQNVFRPLGIDDIARLVPVSRRTLERKFRAQFGRSPLDELRRLRISKARRLLATTEMSVGEIAAACGYGTPEYMTMRFRLAVGKAPLRYRTAVRAR